jgi:hybrid cluster-associated redox disulfide protein
MTMDEIMRLWPATIPVILHHHMMCAGCPIAPFHTVDEAICAHGMDGERFRRDLADAIARQEEKPASNPAGLSLGKQE